MSQTETFQFQFFSVLNKAYQGKNILISPISIYHILSLTANGSMNQTLAEMLKALSEKDLKEMNVANKELHSIIDNFKTMEIANAVFTKFKPLESFTKIIKEYKSEIDILQSVEQVNKWCNEKTHGKIPNILKTLTPNDLMVLINAIYFKGKWEKAFDKNMTRKMDFMNLNKTPKQVLFMNMKADFNYFENKELQAISLPYKEDNLEAMIILPSKELDINNYISNLTNEKYVDIKNKFNKQKIKLSLPKFTIQFGDELRPYFNALGMVIPFSDEADFSSMSKENKLKIGRIIHKSFIEVDEEGTVAAAATAVVMKKRMMVPAHNIEMIVDHPFLFIIRSNKLAASHDILFISKIECL